MGSSSNDFEVIVVGAGIMGSATAYQAAKRGYKTLLLEQFDFLHHRGSSHGESRTIRATYPEDYYTAMALEAYSLWEQAEAEIGYKVYFRTHQFDMGPTNSRSLKALVASCRKISVPHRVLNSSAVAREFTGKVQIPEGWVGVCTDRGGILKPTKAVSMFQTLALRNGAVLRDNAEVKGIERGEDGGVVVFAGNGGVFRGRKCVVTVGAWTRKLIKTVSRFEIPVQPLETNVFYWRIKAGHEADYSYGGDFPTFASYGNPYIYGTPSFEFPGLIKVAVHGGYTCDPDKRPWGPGMSMSELRKWIDGRFSGRVESDGPVATQMCMYSMTPDEDFVLDFLGGKFGKDVVVGAGFSGHGFKMGPVVGRILADMVISGEAKGVDLKPFRIARFVENPKGNVKDHEDQVNLFHQTPKL
ncbi:hypothetical protein UlMin_035609 [Ulmus minor]